MASSWLNELLQESGSKSVTDLTNQAVGKSDECGANCGSKDEAGFDPVSFTIGRITQQNMDNGKKSNKKPAKKPAKKKPKKESAVSFTEDELRTLYSESVAEVIRENADMINAKYNGKVAALMKQKKQQIATESANQAKAQQAVSESAVNDMIADFFGD